MRLAAKPALKLVGEQRITFTGTAAYSINSTVQAARVLRVSVETAAVRARFGSTNPTMTTGLFLAANALVEWDNYDGTSLLKFTRVTGAPVVNVIGFNWAGDA